MGVTTLMMMEPSLQQGRQEPQDTLTASDVKEEDVETPTGDGPGFVDQVRGAWRRHGRTILAGAVLVNAAGTAYLVVRGDG